MIEKLYKSPITYIMIIGIAVTAYLFSLLLKFADEGNLVMVLLASVSIGVIALFITKFLNYQKNMMLLEK